MGATKTRLEGFAGQHLVVLPKPARDAALRHPLLRGLMVTDAGYYPQAEGHHVEREAGVSTHLVIICLKGRGWFRSRTREAMVSPGDAVWLRANEPHAYGADLDNPWTIAWVHFAGDEAEHWRKYSGFSNEPVAVLNDVSEDGFAALKLEQIYLSLEKGYSTPELVSTAVILRQTFDRIAQVVRTSAGTRSAAARIATACEHLRENLAKSHRLDELAAAAGLSVPHFCALFRRKTGYAPIDYLIRQRMQRACQLLDTTEERISDIAASVGYDDAYYFSRSFRKIVGYSPRAYRNIPKG